LTIKPKEEFVQTLRIILGGDFDVDDYPLDYDRDDAEAERAFTIFPKQSINATNFKIAQQIAGVPIIER